MQKLFYVVKKQLTPVIDGEITTGWKTITVYDIDTQAMHLVEFCEIEATNDKSSEAEIQTWLDNNGHESTEFEFVEL